MTGWKRFRFAAPFGLVALGMAPLTIVYFRNLWSRPHYQFFPVLIAAVAMLLMSRWKGHRMEAPVAPTDDDEEFERPADSAPSSWI
ncbi:MAG TPA: hypothetical protein VM510_13880, partial [Caulifigura sp.]|nr:hypothetical protein [Caulifigura sp.]